MKNTEGFVIHWTNYRNISQWFNNWEKVFFELGMAVSDPMTNWVMILIEQFRNIINFDKTTLSSLDGLTQNKGGHPANLASLRWGGQCQSPRSAQH